MALRGTLVRNGKLIPAGVYLLAGIGLFCLLAGVPPLWEALPVLLTGERRRAKVVNVREAVPPIPGRYVVELEFQEKATERMQRVPILRSDYRRTARMRMDQIVQIIYDKNDPKRFELLSVTSEWQGGVFGIVLGAGLLVFAWKAPKTA